MSDLKLKDLNLSNEDVASIINGARSYRQFLEMITWIEKGICKFCPEHRDPELNKVICKRGVPGYEWVMWHNPYPHKHTSAHIMLVPDRHVTHCKDLTANDALARMELEQFIMSGKAGVDVGGGAFGTRFGDPKKNAGSIRHLHVNYIVPDGTGNVKLTIAKTPKKIEDAKKRVEIFEKLRQAEVAPGDNQGLVRILTEEEYVHIRDRL